MPELMQLRTDGTEVPYEDVLREQRRHLSRAQSEILLTVRIYGSIRASQAGVFVHAARQPPHCAGGVPFADADPNRLGCCRYAASDGNAACKRLEKRGLLVKEGRGRWVGAVR